MVEQLRVLRVLRGFHKNIIEDLMKKLLLLNFVVNCERQQRVVTDATRTAKLSVLVAGEFLI